jgi:hypothetical protein
MRRNKSNPEEIAIAALVIAVFIGFFVLQYTVTHHGELPFAGWTVAAR